MAQAQRDPEQLAKDYTALWNERDYSNIPDVVAESFVHESPAAPEGGARGHDGLEEFMREITAAFPDFRCTIVEMLSDEETVMVEVEFTMTHEGEFEGIPATGREIELRAMAKARVDDGKLQELREYANLQRLLEQLGVED